MVLDKCHTGALSSAGEGDEKVMLLNFRESVVGAEMRCLGRDEGGETQDRTWVARVPKMDGRSRICLREEKGTGWVEAGVARDESVAADRRED